MKTSCICKINDKNKNEISLGVCVCKKYLLFHYLISTIIKTEYHIRKFIEQ